MKTCCNHDCRQGRDCPRSRPPRDYTLGAALLVLAVLVVLCGALGEIYR